MLMRFRLKTTCFTFLYPCFLCAFYERISFNIPNNNLKQLSYVTTNANLYIAVTPSLRRPSSLPKVPNTDISITWGKSSLHTLRWFPDRLWKAGWFKKKTTTKAQDYQPCFIPSLPTAVHTTPKSPCPLSPTFFIRCLSHISTITSSTAYTWTKKSTSQKVIGCIDPFTAKGFSIDK